MKIPYVKRKELIKSQEDLKISETSLRHTESSLHCLRKDLKTAKKIISDVLPRFFKINITDNRDFETYRVCVDIHRDMVERAFTHGGSSEEIEYMAEMLGHQVGRKMIQFNFARCSKL